MEQAIEQAVTDTPLRITVDWTMDHLVGIAAGQVIDGKPQSARSG